MKLLELVQNAVRPPKALPESGTLDAAIITNDRTEIARHCVMLGLSRVEIEAIERVLPDIAEVVKYTDKHSRARLERMLICLPHNREKFAAVQRAEIEALHATDVENRRMENGKLRAVIGGRLASVEETEAIYEAHEAEKQRIAAENIAAKKRAKAEYFEACRWVKDSQFTQ